MSRIGNDNCSEFFTITLLRRGKQVLLVKLVSTFQCNNIMFTYLKLIVVVLKVLKY